VIYFMAFDLRSFAECAPPGVSPAYAIPTAQPRLPSLIFSAERDGDLTYPIADQFIDRATGPTTFVTVYGGCHDFLGDANDYDAAGATIPRADEQNRVASFVVAFIRRWAQDDVSLEGFLYGDDHSTSTTVGVASWHRVSPQLLVDDFQGADPAHNALGGDNSVVGLRRAVDSVYPSSFAPTASLGIRQSVLTLAPGNGAFTLTLGSAGGSQDVSAFRSLLVRVMQESGQGFQVDMWVRLTDATGNQGYAQVAKADGSSLGYLPATVSGGSSFSRFVTLTVPLAEIAQSNSALDFTAVTQVEFDFGGGGATKTVVLDDVRFE
jgi:hypothetical protein